MVKEIGNLSLLGFVDGFTATCIIISAVLFGSIALYHGRKLDAKLLSIAGLINIFTGLFWLGPASDFFMVLITGNNIDPEYLYGWLSYMWIAPAVIVAFYLGSELIVPKMKNIITGVYAILGAVFEILLWAMPIGSNGVFIFNPHGEGDLIDSGFNRLNPAFWLIAFFLISVFVFLVIGMAIKAKQTTGDLRKKFVLISLAYLIFFVCGIADALFIPGLYLGIWRGVMITNPLLLYLGFKTKS